MRADRETPEESGESYTDNNSPQRSGCMRADRETPAESGESYTNNNGHNFAVS